MLGRKLCYMYILQEITQILLKYYSHPTSCPDLPLSSSSQFPPLSGNEELRLRRRYPDEFIVDFL